MVPADQGDAVWISDLECQEQQKGLHAVKPSVNVVAQKQILFVRHIPANLHQHIEGVDRFEVGFVVD